MGEAERDEVDAETQGFLKACNARIDSLKLQAVAASASDKAGGQLQSHYQGMLQLLYEQLQEVAQLYDVLRSFRLQKAVNAREARVGVSAAALIRHMHEQGGFHAYVLADEDYEITRCHDAVHAPPRRPRRLRPGEPIRFEQADVVFSREDAEWL